MARTIPTPVGNTSSSLPQRAHRPDHPHARGEHRTVKAHDLRSDGPSPRPWGTRRHELRRGDAERTIPTPVGNTERRSGATASGPDHPHARGEHRQRLAVPARQFGPSPRPWGTPARRATTSPTARTIPTPVGNTPGARSPAPPLADHPHARGEHAQPKPPAAAGTDHPHARGEHAAAGSSGPAATDHPHARGEHDKLPSAGTIRLGPSPRPWGTPARVAGYGQKGRTIPTPVGNTASLWNWSTAGTDHPHARGEHAGLGYTALYWAGPSPRPWGTLTLQNASRTAVRTIPTPVGNTHAGILLTSAGTDHPHARGEHLPAGVGGIGADGPSPRPWGTRVHPNGRRWEERTIPTPVGNTAA